MFSICLATTYIFRMGVGLAEYRAAIGRFAIHAQSPKIKLKSKLSKTQQVTEGQSEKVSTGQTFNTKFNKSGGSLNRWKTRSKSRCFGKRSKTVSPQSARRNSKKRKCLSVRVRSQSNFKRRDKGLDFAKTIQASCSACRTDWLSQECTRGRARKRRTRLDQKTCCPSGSYESNNKKEKNVFFMTCIAAFECIMLEYILSLVVRMLLIRSGIETNPGPFCCSAGQHFNRVNKTRKTVKEKFQSRLTQTTLTSKTIEIVETGIGDVKNCPSRGGAKLGQNF